MKPILAVLPIIAVSLGVARAEPVKMIFDTDMGDDVGRTPRFPLPPGNPKEIRQA